MKPINGLSLFNGMGCLWMALQELGIKVDKRYISEIDKFANEANNVLFPDSIQLGDVRNVDVSKLEKVDIVAAGSPCTDLSFAGTQSGLICSSLEDYLILRNKWLKTGDENLYFHNGKFQQSILFWEFIRILREVKDINPDVIFFLENVRMDKKQQRIINQTLGIEPVFIDSNLVSAQNRKRWYWSNVKIGQKGLFGDLFTDIPQPEDRKLFIKDIVQPESEVDEKYYIKNPKFGFDGMDISGKSNCLRTGWKGSQSDKHNCDIIKIDKQGNKKADQNKASCLTGGGNSGGNHSDMDIICVSMVGRRIDKNGIRKDNDKSIQITQRLEANESNKSNCLTTVEKDNLLILQKPRGNNKGGVFNSKSPTLTSNSWEQNNILINNNYIQWDSSGKGHKSQQDRAYFMDSKFGTIPANRTQDKIKIVLKNGVLRRFTPLECMRLQAIPKWCQQILLNSGISDSQLYKMLGNGWTVEIIVHILSFIKK